MVESRGGAGARPRLAGAGGRAFGDDGSGAGLRRHRPLGVHAGGHPAGGGAGGVGRAARAVDGPVADVCAAGDVAAGRGGGDADVHGAGTFAPRVVGHHLVHFSRTGPAGVIGSEGAPGGGHRGRSRRRGCAWIFGRRGLSLRRRDDDRGHFAICRDDVRVVCPDGVAGGMGGVAAAAVDAGGGAGGRQLDCRGGAVAARLVAARGGLNGRWERVSHVRTCQNGARRLLKKRFPPIPFPIFQPAGVV